MAKIVVNGLTVELSISELRELVGVISPNSASSNIVKKEVKDVKSPESSSLPNHINRKNMSWSSDELKLLRELHYSFKSDKQIARIMGRSPVAVCNKRSELKISNRSRLDNYSSNVSMPIPVSITSIPRKSTVLSPIRKNKLSWMCTRANQLVHNGMSRSDAMKKAKDELTNGVLLQ